MPKVGGVYKHYKGTLYKVLFIARHSDTEEELVIYQDIEHPEKIWARAPSVFMEDVEINGKTFPRFELQ
ncbi:MAG TPA: DUF1653 domain-containing protein [Candidatus Paceibacterota bacterium]|nr:DUF1653 domain-containing protein [Candidatus Paceibacterota bacterium]